MIFLLLLLPVLPAQQPHGVWAKEVQIVGAEDGANFSRSMASMGDLDGDGVRELIVGAYSSALSGFASGSAYVYSGRSGVLIYSFFGEYDSSGFGISVDCAGDVNADGLDDLLVGASGADYYGWGEGAAYVISGRDGQRIHRLLGNSFGPGDLGLSVSGLGDLNLDGYDDFIVGDPTVDIIPGGSGAAYCYSGRDGSVLIQLGAPGDFGVGARVRGIGDLTGDGIPEFLVAIGGAVVVHSGLDGSEIRRHPYVFPWDNFGDALADLGDLDRDGVSDYAITAPAGSTGRTGRVYIYSGASGLDLLELIGTESGGEFGSSVAGPGDVDGDGFPDILVGAPHENSTWRNAVGVAHLFSGFNGRPMGSLTGDLLRSHYIGTSVAGAGDVNDDGLADIVIGSASAGGGVSNGVVRTFALRSYLNLLPRAISASAGGTLDLQLDFPDSDAGKQYLLLASGGDPGRTRVLGHWLPLARTPLLDLMLRNPPAFIYGAQGSLDAQGNAAANATLAPNQAAAWVGRTIKFVAVSFDGHRDISLYSAAMSLTIEP